MQNLSADIHRVAEIRLTETRFLLTDREGKAVHARSIEIEDEHGNRMKINLYSSGIRGLEIQSPSGDFLGV